MTSFPLQATIEHRVELIEVCVEWEWNERESPHKSMYGNIVLTVQQTLYSLSTLALWLFVNVINDFQMPAISNQKFSYTRPPAFIRQPMIPPSMKNRFFQN